MTLGLPHWDLVLRGAVAGLLLHHVVLLVVPGPKRAVRWTLAAFAASVIAYLVCQQPVRLLELPRPLAIGLLALGAWEWAVRAKEIPSYILPGPIEIGRTLWRDWPSLAVSLGITLPELVEFGQGYQSMSPAIKVFETKLIEGTLRHDGNPCLTWCASNVVAIQDAAENKKYDKSRSVGRIDGVIAAVMACGILEEMEERSVYDGMTADQIKQRIVF
jgi:hypothetical protein